MWDYACEDAVVAWRVWFQLRDHPRWLELPDTLWSDKQDLVRVLVQMKRYGVRIDTELAEEYIAKGEAEMKRLAAEMGYPAKPTKKNPDPLPTLGPIALADLFLERLGMPIIKRGKPNGRWPDGAPSFDKSVMEEYDILLEGDERPEAKLLKQYRGWQKAVSASYRPYLELLDSDGRLRCSYKTHGTVTGRLSCSKPNLQQIPKESVKEWNGKVKECFIPEDGYVLVNADFSQLELRLGTAYANEQRLKQVFNEGRDIFNEMAADLGMVRQDTKTLVYSMQYGAGLQRIMNVFRVTKQRAEQIRRNYFATYPHFRILSERCDASAKANHEVRIWSGRKRHFRFASESYKAMNSVIQGGAADIMERVMVRCFRELDSDDCRMLLQVHDSITWEVKRELVPEMMAAIKAAMEDVAGSVGHDEFDVRFAVEVDYWTDREKERMVLAA
jgi:DNA polymerase-1